MHSRFSEFIYNAQTLSYVTVDNGACVTRKLRQNLQVTTFLSAYSKRGGTTLNGREEGGQYYILQTFDQERFEARKAVFTWECLIIFATSCRYVLWEPTDCTSMLWSVDWQNKVSAAQYHLTVSRAEVSTHLGRVVFEGICWQVTIFQMIAGSFFELIWNMLCLCHYGLALWTFWFQTEFGH